MSHKTAWHLLHRIRETWRDQEGEESFRGPVEVDEMYVGSQGIPVIGMKDRDTGQVLLQVVDKVNKQTIHPFIHENTTEDAKIYTDGAKVYKGITRYHDFVVYRREWARGDVTTNRIENVWSVIKRGCRGVYYNVSRQHLHRYILEFEGRFNQRSLGTYDGLVRMVKNSVGKRLKFKDLLKQGTGKT